MKTLEHRKDPYQRVTDLIIEHLERGTVPWRCPWQKSVGIPRNFHTGRSYNGINVLLLGLSHHASPWWLTYQQALQRGGQVRKSEHGSGVIKVGNCKAQQAETPASPEPVDSSPGDSQGKGRRFLREYTVFNATQIDGIEFPPLSSPHARNQDERIEAAEMIVAEMPDRPSIHEGARTTACYRLTTDTVQMPAYGSFESAETYYHTLFHELIHSTGHPNRLNRESLIKHDGFGGKVYSQEELVAEMGAAFLGLEADIVSDTHEQSAAYLQSWLSVLRVKENKRWMINAASQATKAADFILRRHLNATT
jgi:antirestriction protein ArdC